MIRKDLFFIVLLEKETPTEWLWRRQWHPTPVLPPGKSREQRSLVGHSPWGREESDTIEHTHTHTGDVEPIQVGEDEAVTH